MTKPLPMRQLRMLNLLEEAAEAGKACPTNDQLCEAMGMNSIGDPPGVMNALAKAGVIRIERFKQSRIITIVASGKATAGQRGDPHYSTDRTIVPQHRLNDADALIFKQELQDYLERTGTARIRLSIEALGHSNGVQNVLAARNPNIDTAGAFRAVMELHPDGFQVQEKSFHPHRSQRQSPEPNLKDDELAQRRGEAERRHAEHVRQCEAAHREKYGDAPFGRPLEAMPA